MDNLTTDARMRSHIIITLIVFWAISERYGTGFSIATFGPVQFIIPNWTTFLALGIGIVAAHRYRAAVLGPVAEWLRWVLVGESGE